MFDSTPVLIPLFKHTYLVAYALVSPEDRHLAELSWSLNHQGYATLSVKTDGEKLMHRMVAQPEEGMVVDHINHIRADNRRENLRNCTQAQNACNTRRIASSTGYRGVVYEKRDGRWQAGIVCNRLRMTVGRYQTAEEAAKAYDSAARALHGEYAVLNFADVFEYTDVNWAEEFAERSSGVKRKPKLTVEELVDIRKKYDDGALQGDLAKQYNVSAVTIHRIVNKKSHLLPPPPLMLEAALQRMAQGEAGHLVAAALKIDRKTLRKAARESWGDNPPTTVYKRREGAKLSLQDVHHILKRVEAGEMQKTLAEEYGVKISTVNGYVKHRKR